jgi:hypothetical protein
MPYVIEQIFDLLQLANQAIPTRVHSVDRASIVSAMATRSDIRESAIAESAIHTGNLVAG